MSSILKPLQLDESPPAPALARSRRRESAKEPLPTRAVHWPTAELPTFSLAEVIPIKEYLVHLPILVIGLGAYLAVFSILNTISPESLQNVWIPNSYAPFLLLVGLAHFCFFSYLFLNTRRGFLASLFLSMVLFLKLQQVLTSSLILYSFLFVIGLEIAFLLFKKIIGLIQPKVKVPRLPQFPRFSAWKSGKTSAHRLPADLVVAPETKTLPKPTKPSRRLGRKRKHHFFGK